jgi:hypothetical protein
MSTERLELPQGTLDLLILKVLSLEPMHGWAILRAPPPGVESDAADPAGVDLSSLAPA